MPTWRVTLTRDPWHLKTLAGLNVGVSEEGGGSVLRRPEFDVLTDAGAVRERAVELVDALNALGERLQAEVIDRATGQPIPPPPPPTFYAKAVPLALRDDAVRRALHFLVPPVTVANLWKVFEVICQEVPEEEIVKGRQWATRGEIRRFRHTVNSPETLGDDARHGVETSEPPSNPMSLAECHEFVKRLLTNWLESN